MHNDPYSVLGIKQSANQDEIRAAYRELAKKLHPDLNPGNKEAERQFKVVNDAYMLLSDPKKREEFDRYGGFGPGLGGQDAGARAQGPFYYETQDGDGARYSSRFSFGGASTGSGEDAGFDDLLGSIFGKMGRRGGPAQAEEYKVRIDLKDAVLGAQKEVILPQGRFTVTIPPGTESGSRLRIPGSGRARDIFLDIELNPSPVFRRAGMDLEVEVPISLSEAILGAEIKVPVIDGEVLLQIPSGVTTGSKLRLRGKGWPARAGKKKPGDQIVSLKIVMPEIIDPELKSMIARWSKEHAYDPRMVFRARVAQEGRNAA